MTSVQGCFIMPRLNILSTGASIILQHVGDGLQHLGARVPDYKYHQISVDQRDAA